VCDLSVQPGDGAAEGRSFGGDDADVVWCEGLAEGTGVEAIDIGIPHPEDPVIPFLVDLPGIGTFCKHGFFIGDERDLDGIEQVREVHPEFCRKQSPEVFYPDSPGNGLF